MHGHLDPPIRGGKSQLLCEASRALTDRQSAILYYIIVYRITLYHIMLYHVVSYIVLYHIISCYNMMKKTKHEVELRPSGKEL